MVVGKPLDVSVAVVALAMTSVPLASVLLELGAKLHVVGSDNVV